MIPGYVYCEKCGRPKEVCICDASSNRACTCVDAGYVAGSDPNCPRHAIPNSAAGTIRCPKCGCVAVTTSSGRWICGGNCPDDTIDPTHVTRNSEANEYALLQRVAEVIDPGFRGPKSPVAYTGIVEDKARAIIAIVRESAT